MDTELAELLKLATAAYAEHGDAQVYFVVHQVDADKRVIDHNVYPDFSHLCSGIGSIRRPDGHFCFDLCSLNADDAVQQWFSIAKKCGAWILANRKMNILPLPQPAAVWGNELLNLPRHCREYVKTVWHCNAFGANVVMLQLIAAGKETEIVPDDVFPSVGQSTGQTKKATAPSPPESGLKQADESLRLGYSDPSNYWRNVWLYDQKKAELTNAAIRAELGKRATEFAPLDSDNAVRDAIESIAEYHGWPALKGKGGRPKSSTRKSNS